MLALDFSSEMMELRLKSQAQASLIDKQAEEICHLISELSTIKKRYVELYKLSNCAFFMIDSNYIIQDLNFAAASLLGHDPSVLMGSSFLNFVSEHSRIIFKNNIENLVSKNSNCNVELEIISKVKGQQFVKIEGFLINDKQISLGAIDITYLRQCESRIGELQYSLAVTNQLFQNCADALAYLDSNLTFKIMNQSFIDIASKIFTTKISAGVNFKNVLLDFPNLYSETIQLCSETNWNQKKSIVIENKTDKLSTYYCYELLLYRVSNSSAAKEFIVCIRDLTESKIEEMRRIKQQAAIEHESKVNAMGELLSCLAHEFNQPLSVIKAYSDSCLLRLKKIQVSELAFPLSQISLQANHAAEIIRRMKNFLCEDSLFLEQTDFNALIKNTISFLQYGLLQSKCEIAFQFSDELPLIKLDQLKIMQVIINLGKNSLEALQLSNPPQPKISIETVLEDSRIVMHFRDNGPGIPKDLQEKIFKPYFTSKTQGTGLGLAICQTLIKAHGGELKLRDCQPGAWFTMKLPIKAE
nr:PAS domain S-box protein [Legionella jordanis]